MELDLAIVCVFPQ
jgi:hypothetical protein